MNIKKSLEELEAYFNNERSTPENISYHTRKAAMTIATHCAHPHELEAKDLEDIAIALEYLSDIVDIIEKYEDEDKAE